MVAFLVLIIFGLALAMLGQWATIDGLRRRNAELEALHAPPTTPPWAMVRAREVDLLDDEPQLPRLGELRGNDEPTKVCRIAP